MLGHGNYKNGMLSTISIEIKNVTYAGKKTSSYEI